MILKERELQISLFSQPLLTKSRKLLQSIICIRLIIKSFAHKLRKQNQKGGTAVNVDEIIVLWPCASNKKSGSFFSRIIKGCVARNILC